MQPTPPHLTPLLIAILIILQTPPTGAAILAENKHCAPATLRSTIYTTISITEDLRHSFYFDKSHDSSSDASTTTIPKSPIPASTPTGSASTNKDFHFGVIAKRLRHTPSVGMIRKMDGDMGVVGDVDMHGERLGAGEVSEGEKVGGKETEKRVGGKEQEEKE